MLRGTVWFLLKKNIDVNECVADPAGTTYNAIAPAEVDQVIFNAEDNKIKALVVVPDNELSQYWSNGDKRWVWQLTLTGYRIDIQISQ